MHYEFDGNNHWHRSVSPGQEDINSVWNPVHISSVWNEVPGVQSSAVLHLAVAASVLYLRGPVLSVMS